MNGPTLAQTPKIPTLSPAPSQTGLLQRKCACGGSPGVDGECAECHIKQLSAQRGTISSIQSSKHPLLGRKVHHLFSQPGDAHTNAYRQPLLGFNFRDVSVRATVPAIQTKLTVNQPGDRYEQEADRVAEQVMRMKEPERWSSVGVSEHGRRRSIQRMPAKPEELRQPDKEEEKLDRSLAQEENGEVDDVLQAKESSGQMPSVTSKLQMYIHSIKGGGQPLSETTRSFFEPRFGHDFSQVRIHSDAQAAESARNVYALAFTVGRNIIFGGGQYRPETTAGRRLLAHELTHLIQQEKLTPHATPIQRKIQMREKGGAGKSPIWHLLTQQERNAFLAKHFKKGLAPSDERHLAQSIVKTMADSDLDFSFDNEAELLTEITKRLKTSEYMLKFQKKQRTVKGGLGKAFGYPDKKRDPRVNKAAVDKKYWGPIQGTRIKYFWELTPKGKEHAYDAIKTLFEPQVEKDNRTLFNCDYLISVVHFRVFAETIGTKKFDEMVSKNEIQLVLRHNGFDEILDKATAPGVRNEPTVPKERLSLRIVRPLSEKDLVIGDHVIFWNDLAYELIRRHMESWKLENAVLVKKKENGENLFQGHGSELLTNRGMRKMLMDKFNAVAQDADDAIKRTKSDRKTREAAFQYLQAKYKFIIQVGEQWRVRGVLKAENIDVNEEFKRIKDESDPRLIGLQDPNNSSRMNVVFRPIESAP